MQVATYIRIPFGCTVGTPSCSVNERDIINCDYGPNVNTCDGTGVPVVILNDEACKRLFIKLMLKTMQQ
jgi:hypothetical protein